MDSSEQERHSGDGKQRKMCRHRSDPSRRSAPSDADGKYHLIVFASFNLINRFGRRIAVCMMYLSVWSSDRGHSRSISVNSVRE